MTDLHVSVWGDGTPVVLVHGSGARGSVVWSRQRPLAERYRLLIPDRRGYGKSPPAERLDFAVDAQDIADLLGEGSHLVGYSYGGVASLLAAAARPEAVLSLAVIEPPAFGLVRGVPEVEAALQTVEAVYAEARRLAPEAFIRRFRASWGMPQDPRPLPPTAERDILAMMRERRPWEAEIPLERLAAMSFPKLVFSGGWNPTFDTLCDTLARGINAARAVLPGHGHAVQQVGKLFNDRLEALWT